MNYQCEPDIDTTKDLTLQAVCLFGRFGQEADKKTVSQLVDREFEKHVKLCELSILYYAQIGCYWAPLPYHPIIDVFVWTIRHFRDMGFDVRLDEKKDAHDRDQRWVAHWLGGPPPDEEFSKEWRRREQFEEEELQRIVPTPQSQFAGDTLNPGGATWATLVDKQYLVEVQRLLHRNVLVVFDAAGKCLWREDTNVAFGAVFGPDVDDVAKWEGRALELVDALRRDRPAAPPDRNDGP